MVAGGRTNSTRPHCIGFTSPGWVDLATANPDDYNPLAYQSGSMRCIEWDSRPGTPVTENPGVGEHLPGVGAWYRHTWAYGARVGVRWSGIMTLGGPRAEATPIVCVNPTSPEVGFGVWHSLLAGVPVYAVGSIGNPPEDFADFVVDYGTYTHTTGTPRTIELVLNADNTACTLWMDGTQVDTDVNGTDPIPLPANLQGSTFHGFELDYHLTQPFTDIPSLPGIYRWWCETG